MTDDPFDGPMPSLPEQLRARACPAGEPHTGDDPAADHGHTDCWLLHQAADRIDALEAATLRAYVPLATSTARQPYTSRIARNALAEVLGLPVVGVDEVGTTLDERDWIAYGVERGWVTEACATHDGIPSTPKRSGRSTLANSTSSFLLRPWRDGPTTPTWTLSSGRGSARSDETPCTSGCDSHEYLWQHQFDRCIFDLRHLHPPKVVSYDHAQGIYYRP